MSTEGSGLFWEGHRTVFALEFGVVVHTKTVTEMKSELSCKAKGCLKIWAEYPPNQWFHCLDHGHVWLVNLCDTRLSTRIFYTQAKQGTFLPVTLAEINLASSTKHTHH